MKDIAIFSARVAKDLIRKGYKLNDIQPDNNIKIKTIFYFKNTTQLRNYLESEHDIAI